MIDINKQIGVYFIVNKLNDKFYVGHSIDIFKRFNSHKCYLRNNKHHCTKLQRAWNKYKEENFDFVVYEICQTEEEAIELEQYFLDNSFSVLYNESKIANYGGDLISKHPNRDKILENRSKTIRKNISKLTKEERKIKYGRPGEQNGMYKKTHTSEARKKISEALKGKPGNRLNKTFEELYGEEKAKKMKKQISENAKKRTGEKNSFYSKKHSEEAKEKMRQAKKGKKPVNCKKIIVDNLEYESLAEASRALNIPVPTISYRIKSKNFPNYIEQ